MVDHTSTGRDVDRNSSHASGDEPMFVEVARWDIDFSPTPIPKSCKKHWDITKSA
jgi:hypothetical protein